jgi:hypothetical protein
MAGSRRRMVITDGERGHPSPPRMLTAPSPSRVRRHRRVGLMRLTLGGDGYGDDAHVRCLVAGDRPGGRERVGY